MLGAAWWSEEAGLGRRLRLRLAGRQFGRGFLLHAFAEFASAARDESGPVVVVLEVDKRPVRGDEEHHLLVVAHQPQDVHERPDALLVPEHEADRGLVRHRAVLGRVEGEVPLLLLHADGPHRPVARVVPAGVPGAEHLDEVVVLAAQVLLHGFVRAVGVTDEDREPSLDDAIQALSHLGAESADAPGASDEHLRHWLLLVRVTVSAKTS